MPEIGLTCSNLKIKYANFSLKIDLSVNKGEMVSVIGPSKSGKSTLLAAICGLERPAEGRITINGTDVTALRPEQRKAAIIYHDSELFPHMTVAQNIAFAMKRRKLSKEETAAEIRRLLELVKLTGDERYKPEDLTLEQRFRTAFARALASEPDVILFDESLSDFESRERRILSTDIRDIQRKTGITMVFSSNDQEEALSIADRVIVLHDGKIEQMGNPEEIYRHPMTEFVATFTGECNILPYDVILRSLRVPETERSKVIYQCFGPEHKLLFRPEDMVVNDMPGLPFPEFFPHLRFENAKIIRVQYLGKDYLVTAQYDEFVIRVYTVYKPASDYITAGIRMTKILEFNNGKLTRH